MLSSPRSVAIALAIVSALIFGVVQSANVRRTGGDSRGMLLASQAILEHGTIRLDAYQAHLDENQYVYAIERGHAYQGFPIGTTLFGVPFVAIELLFGRDMRFDEPAAQIDIAAVLAVAIFLMLFRIARLTIGALPSLGLAAVFWFGSSLASTLGTALWSHNFAVLFALLAIYLVLVRRGALSVAASVWVASLLIAAYLCRPALSILSPVLIVYILRRSRRAALTVAAGCAVLLCAFVGYSTLEFGTPLPSYYVHWRGEGHIVSGLHGLLMSPSRGLLVFSPFLLLLLLYVRPVVAAIRTEWQLGLFLVWPALHTLVVAGYAHWWGGFSYGPRFMADIIPGLFVVFVALARSQGSRPLFWSGFVLTGVFAVYVNSVQGLFNPFVARWNAQPNVDGNPSQLFDWRYPQFLHNERRHWDRLAEYVGKDLRSMCPGEKSGDVGAETLRFLGWSAPEEGQRRAIGEAAWILFKTKDSPDLTGRLVVDVVGRPGQGLELWLNWARIASFRFGTESASRTVEFDVDLLRTSGVNILEFRPASEGADPAGTDSTPSKLNLTISSFGLLPK